MCAYVCIVLEQSSASVGSTISLHLDPQGIRRSPDEREKFAIVIGGPRERVQLMHICTRRDKYNMNRCTGFGFYNDIQDLYPP